MSISVKRLSLGIIITAVVATLVSIFSNPTYNILVGSLFIIWCLWFEYK